MTKYRFMCRNCHTTDFELVSSNDEDYTIKCSKCGRLFELPQDGFNIGGYLADLVAEEGDLT